MVVAPLPPAAELVSYVVSISASYQALHAIENGFLDPRFRRPAGDLLETVGESFTFQKPRVELQGKNMFRVLSHFEIARFITERVPYYAKETNHWKTLLHREPEFQRELWNHIEATAEGFVQAGYHVYALPEAPGTWANDVLKKGHRKITAPQPPPGLPDLGLPIRRLWKCLDEKDYDRAVQEIRSIRRESSGAAARHIDFYFHVLHASYLGTPYGSRIRELIAEELEASRRSEALGHLGFEAVNILNHWARLKGWQKLRQCRLLWKALQAGLRYRRVDRFLAGKS